MLFDEEPQNSDGTPHFTYFDHDTQLSFIWDGISDYIQVCHGGYGEPVIDDIPTHRGPIEFDTSLGWLQWFASTCHAYIVIKKNT